MTKWFKDKFAGSAVRILMIFCMFFTLVQIVRATTDVEKTTAWAQLIGGHYDSTPATLADGENDGLRLQKDGRLSVAPHKADTWAVYHAPGPAAQATITKAAVDGSKHVCKGAIFTYAAGTTAPTGNTVTAIIRDGATGAGTIKFQGVLALTAVSGTSCLLSTPPLYIIGTNNTAMTAEFGAAGVTGTNETVFMLGEDIPN